MIIRTEAAELERLPGQRMEIRFMPGVKLTNRNIREVLDARIKLSGDDAFGVLVTVPIDIDFDVNVLNNDHYKDRELDKCTYAVSWDAESTMNEQLVQIFYRYFPQPFPVNVFRTRKAAGEWLDTIVPPE